jgi:hypothetical protein
MSKGATYFWVKFAKEGVIQGGPSTARVGGGEKPGEMHAADRRFLSGYTIRPQLRMGLNETVASMTFIASDGMNASMPCAFYPDETDPGKNAMSFTSETAAMAEKAKQAFKDWAADGTAVLVALAIAQPDSK